MRTISTNRRGRTRAAAQPARQARPAHTTLAAGQTFTSTTIFAFSS